MAVSAEQEKISLSELGYLNVELTDETGNSCGERETDVRVTVTGAGELITVGSANPFTEENIPATSCKTYHGKAQIIIRPIWAGEIFVNVETEFIKKSIKLEAEKEA